MPARQSILSRGPLSANTQTQQTSVVPGSMGSGAGLQQMGAAVSGAASGVIALASQKNNEKFAEKAAIAKEQERYRDRAISDELQLAIDENAKELKELWSAALPTVPAGEHKAQFEALKVEQYAKLTEEFGRIKEQDPERAARLFTPSQLELNWNGRTNTMHGSAITEGVVTKRKKDNASAAAVDTAIMSNDDLRSFGDFMVAYEDIVKDRVKGDFTDQEFRAHMAVVNNVLYQRVLRLDPLATTEDQIQGMADKVSPERITRLLSDKKIRRAGIKPEANKQITNTINEVANGSLASSIGGNEVEEILDDPLVAYSDSEKEDIRGRFAVADVQTSLRRLLEALDFLR